MKQRSVVDHVQQAHDLADPSANNGQRWPARGIGASAFELQERERDRRQDDVMRPAPIAPPFEMVEPQVVFELAVLLFDRPAGSCQRDEGLQRGGRNEV